MATRQERGDDSNETGNEGQEHEGRVGASGGTPFADIGLGGIAKGPTKVTKGTLRAAGVDEVVIEKIPLVVAVGFSNGDRENLAQMLECPLDNLTEQLTIPPARRARLVTPSRTHVMTPSRESTNKATIPIKAARTPRDPVKMA